MTSLKTLILYLNLALYSDFVQLFSNDLCGDQGLTTIGSKEECIKAAKLFIDAQHELTFATETDKEYPRGCYEYFENSEPDYDYGDDDYEDDEFIVYFNYHQGGPRNELAEPLCIWQRSKFSL